MCLPLAACLLMANPFIFLYFSYVAKEHIPVMYWNRLVDAVV